LYLITLINLEPEYVYEVRPVMLLHTHRSTVDVLG